jgi:N-acetylmuramoyl-L-alanine amidase
LDKELKRCGFATLLVAPTDEDVSLGERVSRANKAKTNFYLSVHANAFNAKLDDKAGGIETFAHFSYPKTVAKAKIIHKWVMKGSKMKDRGVKNGDWLYVCKNTAMEAALVELGFMDNIEDLKKLMNDSYRKECAVELAQALCEIYNMKYVPEAKPKPTPKPTIKKGTYYRVVTGSFTDRKNADQRIAELKKAGFDSFIDIYEK